MSAGPLIFDSHLDLAYNALSLNRDLTEPLELIRGREAGMVDAQSRGNATVCLPEMRRGRVALCLSTLLVRANRSVRSTLRQDLDVGTQQIACAVAHGQLAYYRALERAGEMRMIRTAAELRDHLAQWQKPPVPGRTLPVGHILSMEGADCIVTPDELEEWWSHGLRVLSLVHYGCGEYAIGTGASGGVTPAGRELLKRIRRLEMVLDVTHLCDQAMAEALELFDGPVIATHHNCRALVPGDRQLTDEQIRTLVSRGAVIGVALDNWMLQPDWRLGVSSRDSVSLANVVDHIDHICQLAGDCAHVGIGSDLDGCFGTEQSPRDLSSIADLQRLAPLLSNRGYSRADIDAVFSGNWIRFFMQRLPQGGR